MSGIILIAEDDELLRHAIVAALRAAGFATVEASDGVEALREARAARFDAVLLDRSMNKLDGLSVLKTLREEGLETPIMFLTAAGRLEDRVHGLEAGADDYMAKPFELAELIARARPDRAARRGSHCAKLSPATYASTSFPAAPQCAGRPSS